MSMRTEATYEDGVLKPDHPLPLREHERVVVSIQPKESHASRVAGMLEWKGDPEVLRAIAEDPEFRAMGSP